MNKSNARNGGNGTTTKNGGRRAKNGNGRNGNGGAKTNTLGRVPRVFGAAYTTENRRPVNNNTVTLSGSDFITKIRVGPKTASTDRIIATFPVTPSGYPGTRITQLSQLYERYRLMKLQRGMSLLFRSHSRVNYAYILILIPMMIRAVSQILIIL